MAKKSIRSRWRIYHRRKKRLRKEKEKRGRESAVLNVSQAAKKREK